MFCFVLFLFVSFTELTLTQTHFPMMLPVCYSLKSIGLDTDTNTFSNVATSLLNFWKAILILRIPSSLKCSIDSGTLFIIVMFGVGFTWDRKQVSAVSPQWWCITWGREQVQVVWAQYKVGGDFCCSKFCELNLHHFS